MKYSPTIGLEIHAELKTATKMFCNSANDPDEKRPNVNICPVCMAHPGTLPVINKEAVRHVLRVGKALGGTCANFTEFDRKNYFYPDIPKGYQISQYKYPLVSGGELRGVAITRVHLEEDTARSVHESRTTNHESSLVDFNRAGVPLMELVTEPVITSSKEAGDFARELQLLLRYLGASEANMEKGQLRVEANISLLQHDNSKFLISNSPNNSNNKNTKQKLGTKVEIKNINSFRAVERAIEYEIKRQAELLERGEKVRQETRGWSDAKQETFSQRVKEGAADYRYFPEPDLPKLYISEIEEFKNLKLPELPWEKRARYKKEYGIKDEDIESFVTNDTLALFFENVIAVLGTDAKEKIKLASNYVTSDIAGLIARSGGTFQMSPEAFAEVIRMADSGEISSRGAKNILAELFTKGGGAKEIAERKGLLQKSDEGELGAMIEKILHENPDAVAGYKKGKENLLQFLIGQAMRESQGSANPHILAKLFKQKLH